MKQYLSHSSIYRHLLAAIATLALVACGTTKPSNNVDTIATHALNNQELSMLVARQEKSWATMQAGGSIKLSGAVSFSSSMQVRMQRGEAIVISLRPLLGVEVGRLVITSDSIVLIDKWHKQYIAEPVTLLSGGLPVTVNDVQDIFLGRPFVLGKGSVDSLRVDQITINPREQGFDMVPNDQPRAFSYQFGYDKQGRMVTLDVQPTKGNSTTYQVAYNEVKATPAGPVAHKVNIATAIKGRNMGLTLDYDDMTWNRSVKIDRTIPRNYKRREAAALTSLFSK